MKAARPLLVVAALAAALPALAGTFMFPTADPPIVIPDASGGVFTACQNVLVSVTATITGVTVQTAVGHSWVGDLTYRLTAPSTSVLTLMNRPGRVGAGFGNSANAAAATPLIFADAAASTQSAEDMGEAPVGTACGTATVVGAGCGPDNYIPAPNAGDTPIPGVGTNLADFNGQNPMGTWTLCVADSAGGDTGTLSTWTLIIDEPVELESFSVE